MLAFSRIPGNAFSFWIRSTLRWSRGRPALPHEAKAGLFGYLTAPEEEIARARESHLRRRYRLDPLAEASTVAVYRKNLYLIDILEKAAEGLPVLTGEGRWIKENGGMEAGARTGGTGNVSALDVGSQDWHYVFGLERWLRHGGVSDGPAGSAEREDSGGQKFPEGQAPGAAPGGGAPAEGRRVTLRGVEVDGYGIYPDFRSRKDYAGAYAARTGNPDVTYEIGDILEAQGGGLDIVTIFYPFVTRHHLLLWGLPLRLFRPAQLLIKAAALIRPGGWLLVFTHTLKEHELFLELGRACGGFDLAKEGQALSNLVDFHEDVTDRRYSVWRRM